jgi:hypothetical protein
MENQENKDLSPDNIIRLPEGDEKNKSINWEKLKLSYFLSSYKFARRFLVDEKYFTANEITAGNIAKNILGWEIEKKEWEKQAMEITMHNLRDSKVVELKNFIEEEGKVISQLLNMAKVAMNDLLTKGKVNGRDVLSLKNTKGFKQVTESTLMILKYSRERLGVPFDNEDEGINNAINFNFDLVNLDEFDPQKLMSFFAKKAKLNGQNDREPIKADDINGVLESKES